MSPFTISLDLCPLITMPSLAFTFPLEFEFERRSLINLANGPRTRDSRSGRGSGGSLRIGCCLATGVHTCNLLFGLLVAVHDELVE